VRRRRYTPCAAICYAIRVELDPAVFWRSEDMEERQFTGFGPQSQRFLDELAAHNNKHWFEENRGRYERELLEPAASLVRALGPRLAESYPKLSYGTQRNGTGSIMRIHRDIRFSPDKRPYKENLGVIFWIGTGKKVELPAFYLHLQPSRAFFYGGQHVFPKPVLERYRAAVDAEATGTALAMALKELEGKGLSVFEEPAYKRVPQGFPREHARADLLRFAGMGVGVDLPAATVGSAMLLEACTDLAENAHPLMDWLCALNERALPAATARRPSGPRGPSWSEW
jgi:uncharacterized protein (TIGR02453 family)